MSQTSRRTFLRTMCGGAATAGILRPSGVLSTQNNEASAQPNLVIFVADDMGWNDVGYHGSEIETPNIDTLAAEGVELDRFYAFPVCSPTRTALMTGRSPIRLGITSPLTPDMAPPAPDEYFLPEMFKSAGYQTWMTGKWHLGDSGGYVPNERGFDHFYGHLGGLIDYETHILGRDVDWQRNGEDIIEPGYSTYLLRDEAIQLINSRDTSKPFFLYCPFNAPHGPLMAPEDATGKYDWIEDETRRIYAAMVEAMDASIGQIISTLEDKGLRDNTLVLFFSDNGANSSTGGGSNVPLRGDKGTVFEGGIRIPACMNWPGVIPSGQQCQQVVTVMDLFPTVAAALNLEAGNSKPFDGVNRWEHIQNTDEIVSPDGIVFSVSEPSPQAAAFHDQWKLVQTVKRDRLYNINEDPGESEDLSADYPDIVQQLSDQIAAMKDTATSVGTTEETPAQYRLEQNYPNPFNPVTTIRYDIPAGSTGVATLKIHDMRGAVVRTLVNSTVSPGVHSAVWDGTDEAGNKVSSGMYLYRLKAGNFMQSYKMTIVR